MEKSPVFAIAKDRGGNIIVADGTKKIKIYKKQKQAWEVMASFENKPDAIVFDHHNRCYLLTGMGIEEADTHAVYAPVAANSLSSEPMGSGWASKFVYLMDKQNNIWTGFAHGEWGGDLFAFSTIKKEFIHLNADSARLELYPVRSIFEDESHVYFSAGLEHIFTNGNIVKFNDFTARSIFKSETYLAKNQADSSVGGEFIGPAFYNTADHCIYFYSQNGVFKGNPANDLSSIGKWEKLFTPMLHWTSGLIDAVGSPMNVTKMEMNANGALVFISQLDGIGIYKNDSLLMVK